MIWFGHKMPAIMWPQARRLKCTDPRCVDNFIGVMEGFIVYNNLEEQAMVLESMSEFLLPQKAIKLYGHLVEIRC